MDIITRAQWGARPPRSRITGDRVSETFLHHSVGYGQGGASYMRQMQNQHMDTNGWSDIAYNFVIDPVDLKVYEGRGWGVRPGSQKGHNKGTWSVCIMGDFRTRQTTSGLLHKIAELVRYGASLGHIPRVLTGGHRDAPNQSTSCPGTNLYAAIPQIRTLIASTPGGDMPLNDADLAAIKATMEDVLGGGRINMPKIDDVDRFGNRGVVNSVWHATSGGVPLSLVLARTYAAAVKAGEPIDPAAVAAKIADELGPEQAALIAAELQKLTLKAV